MTTITLLNILSNQVPGYMLTYENHTQYNQFSKTAVELFQNLEREGRRWVGVCNETPFLSCTGGHQAIVFERRSDYTLGWYHAPDSWLGRLEEQTKTSEHPLTVVSAFDDFPAEALCNSAQEVVQTAEKPDVSEQRGIVQKTGNAVIVDRGFVRLGCLYHDADEKRIERQECGFQQDYCTGQIVVTGDVKEDGKSISAENCHTYHYGSFEKVFLDIYQRLGFRIKTRDPRRYLAQILRKCRDEDNDIGETVQQLLDAGVFML